MVAFNMILLTIGSFEMELSSVARLRIDECVSIRAIHESPLKSLSMNNGQC